MARQDAALLVDQHRVRPAELDQGSCDLSHLRLAVRARVALVRAQLVDRPELDPLGERNQRPCGARLRFQSQGCDAMLEQAGNIASHRCFGGSSMPNHWMSFWLSAANVWASAARGFWTAEMRRQQMTMLNEMTRQMVRFWTGAWAQPSSDAKTRTRRR